MPQRPGWPDGAPRRSGLSPARRKRQPPFPGRLPVRDGGAGWERQRRSAFLAMGFPEFVLRTAGQACPQWDEGNARGGSTAAAALLGEFVRESLLHRDDRHGVRLLFSVCFAACRRCSLDVAHSVASSDAAFNLPSSGERLLRSQDAGGDSIHAIESRSSRKRDAKGAGRTPHPRHREQALLQAGRPDHSPNNDFRRKRSARRRTASWALHERSPRRGNRGDGRFAAGR